MKKASILLIIACTFSLNACAQWYLFPGKKKQTEPPKTAMDTVKRARPDSARLHPGLDSAAVSDADSTLLSRDGRFVLDVPDVIHVGLALPLQASTERPSDNFLDFFSGALLAVRDLDESGIKMDLQIYDTADSKTTIPLSMIDESDVIIGPISAAELENNAPLCEGKVLISPLDPKAASLAVTRPIVQAPSNVTAQTDELIRWIREEMPLDDVLYVVLDSASNILTDQSAYFVQQLQKRGVRYQNVLRISEIPFDKEHKARVAIACDKDDFIASTVRALGIEGARTGGVLLYGTSRVRTNGVSQNDLHNTEAHLTLSYFVDYDDPAVKQFVLAYRSLYQNEPGSFAFQGYDTMHYFVTICSQFGRQWYKRLPEYSQNGLQLDFRFREESGRINQAARRVIYNADLTTSVLR